jgi:hypothetical protein
MGNCGGSEVKPQPQVAPKKEQQQPKIVAVEESTTTKVEPTSEKKETPAVVTADAPPQTKSDQEEDQEKKKKEQQEKEEEEEKKKKQKKEEEAKEEGNLLAAALKKEEEEEEKRKKEKEQQEAAEEEAKRKKQQQQEKEKQEEEKKKKEKETAAATAATTTAPPANAEPQPKKDEENEKEKEQLKQKQQKLEQAILAYQIEKESAQKWKPDGPADLRDRSIHRACLNNPSIIQIKDLFGKNDEIVFREMMFKMRIKKGLVGRSGFHPVLGLIVGNFFFYLPEKAGDTGNATAEAIQCLGSLYLKGCRFIDMESVGTTRRVQLEASVPRKKGDGKGGDADEASLQLGFATEEQRSKFLNFVQAIAVPKPSDEVAAALKAAGKDWFVTKAPSANDLTVSEGTGAAAE